MSKGPGRSYPGKSFAKDSHGFYVEPVTTGLHHPPGTRDRRRFRDTPPWLRKAIAVMDREGFGSRVKAHRALRKVLMDAKEVYDPSFDDPPDFVLNDFPAPYSASHYVDAKETPTGRAYGKRRQEGKWEDGVEWALRQMHKPPRRYKDPWREFVQGLLSPSSNDRRVFERTVLKPYLEAVKPLWVVKINELWPSLTKKVERVKRSGDSDRMEALRAIRTVLTAAKKVWLLDTRDEFLSSAADIAWKAWDLVWGDDAA